MKLVILLCQLGLILRADAQTPDVCSSSSTNRPPENSDITVVCGAEHMDLSIYLCPLYNAFYNESLMVLNNQVDKPECYGTADFCVDPPVLTFRVALNQRSLSACNNNLEITSDIGTGFSSEFSCVQYVNISGIVTSVNPSVGMITYRPQILYKFSCLYPMEYVLSNTELSVSGVTLAIQDNSGSFINTLNMELYKDEQYQEVLTIPETGLDLKTKIYVAVKATNLTDRFNVLLDRCYATTSPNPLQSTYYDLFVGCTHEAQTVVEVNGMSQKAQFFFEAFRSVEHEYETVSTFYLHCVTRLCELSTCSSLLPDCRSFQRLWKRKAQKYASDSTTVTSPAIRVKNPKRKAEFSGPKTTDLPVDTVFDGSSSLRCSSIPAVVVTVCSIILTVLFSI